MNRIERYLDVPTNQASYLAGVEDGRRSERKRLEQEFLADVERMYWVGVRDGLRLTWGILLASVVLAVAGVVLWWAIT